MENRNNITLLLLMGLFFCFCTGPKSEIVESEENVIKLTQLNSGDAASFEVLRKAFATRNPGYDLHYFAQTQSLLAADVDRVLFVQEGSGTVTLNSGASSKFTVGEIILLGKTESLATDSVISLLAFTVPEKFPPNVPTFIRPDWDEKITDTPGGCATETNAYRRILLTWLSKVGPYRYHALNAHRVRIMDSFTHYHPEEGGFDEFYLVQMAQPNAKLITSTKLDLIKHPEKIKEEEVKDLLQITPLKVGDLIYMPKGVIHRGLDGVLAQVITVPGFIPGSEIGVDHYLKAINDRLELSAGERLPFNENASSAPIVK